MGKRIQYNNRQRIADELFGLTECFCPADLADHADF